jgi:hypothetical protein
VEGKSMDCTNIGFATATNDYSPYPPNAEKAILDNRQGAMPHLL